ncbi:MAG: hypothetical protein QM820_64610 [Minicystis sp.]
MHSTSLAQYLDLLAPALPPGLFAPAGFEGMCRAVAFIPWALLSLFGFECRLDDDDAGADILFAANLATGGRRILNGRNPWVEFSAQGQPSWRPIAAFCQRWDDPSSALYEGADDVWFECDVALGAEEVPSFFFGPRVGSAPDAVAATRRILLDGFGALLGAPLAGATLACLDRCLALLPAHARVFQTGLMLSRPERQLRLCLDNLSSVETVELVGRVLGAREAACVAETIRAIEPHARSLKLAIDVGAEVGPRVGIECYAVSPRRRADPPAWADLLGALVASGWCLPSRRDALLALRPLLRSSDLRAPWPVDAAAQLSALVGREQALAVKVHHVKLTVEAGHPTRAKAYIAVERVWLS